MQQHPDMRSSSSWKKFTQLENKGKDMLKNSQRLQFDNIHPGLTDRLQVNSLTPFLKGFLMESKELRR